MAPRQHVGITAYKAPDDVFIFVIDDEVWAYEGPGKMLFYGQLGLRVGPRAQLVPNKTWGKKIPLLGVSSTAMTALLGILRARHSL